MFQRLIAGWRGRGVGRCGLYLLDDAVLVCPVQGITTSAPEAVQVPLEADPLGHAVLAALRASTTKAQSGDMAQGIAAFEARMEAFRQQIGAGKQRFMRDLRHLSVGRTQQQTEVRLWQAARGRFAFEGTDQRVVLTGEGQFSAQEIGAAVLALLER